MNRTQTSELARNREDLRRQIAQRAYALYEQRGRQNGFAMQDWLQAERELARAAERPTRKLLLEQGDLKRAPSLSGLRS
jgi:hypothetical protein